MLNNSAPHFSWLTKLIIAWTFLWLWQQHAGTSSTPGEKHIYYQPTALKDMPTLKEVILCILGFCLPFIVVCNFFVHVKGPAVLPQCQKCLVYSWAFSWTYVQHYVKSFIGIHIFIYLLQNIYTPVSQQTYSCYCYSCIILDHTTLLSMTHPTLPLIGYILPATLTKGWTEAMCLSLYPKESVQDTVCKAVLHRCTI